LLVPLWAFGYPVGFRFGLVGYLFGFLVLAFGLLG
jgi:hypothetical protein